MLYTPNLYSDVCQLFLNKTGEKNQKKKNSFFQEHNFTYSAKLKVIQSGGSLKWSKCFGNLSVSTEVKYTLFSNLAISLVDIIPQRNECIPSQKDLYKSGHHSKFHHNNQKITPRSNNRKICGSIKVHSYSEILLSSKKKQTVGCTSKHR